MKTRFAQAALMAAVFISLIPATLPARDGKKDPASIVQQALRRRPPASDRIRSVPLPGGAAKIIEIKTQTRIQDAWVDATRSTYEYEGDLLLLQEDASRDVATGQWVVNNRRELTGFGSADTVAYSFRMDGNMVPDYREITEYTYDFVTGDRRTLRYLEQQFENGAWVNTSVDTLLYHNGQVAGGISWVWEDGWQRDSRFFIEEKDGNTLQHTEIWVGFGWLEVERTTFFGMRASDLERVVNDLENTEVAFGLAGIFAGFPEMLTESWNGDAFVPESRLEREDTYDFISGALVRRDMISQVNNGGAWATEAVFVTEYGTTPGLLIRAAMELEVEGQRIRMLQEDFTYQNGRVAIVEVRVPNMESGTQLLVSRHLVTWQSGTSAEPGRDLPAAFELGAAYPNPFNPTARIPFTLRSALDVNLSVYDLTGRRVAVLVQGRLPAGQHTAEFNARGLASGVYTVRLQSGNSARAAKLTLVK